MMLTTTKRTLGKVRIDPGEDVQEEYLEKMVVVHWDLVIFGLWLLDNTNNTFLACDYVLYTI
jgi:hypothetical protein